MGAEEVPAGHSVPRAGADADLPMTEMQEAMGVMADSLEWAKTSGLIDERQYQLILYQYQARMRDIQAKNMRVRSDSF